MMPLTENGRNARICGYSTMVVQQPSKLLEPAQIPTMSHAKQRRKLAFGIKRLGFGSKKIDPTERQSGGVYPTGKEGRMDGMAITRRFVRREHRDRSWAGLPNVRTVRAKGKTYLYFNARPGGRLYYSLPDPDSSDFDVAYAAMAEALATGGDIAAAAQQAVAAHDARRCFVYFIGASEGPVKIGYVRNLAVRLREIQVGNPYRLSILATVEGRSIIERQYHQQFAAARLQGEWFARTPEIEAEIARLTAKDLAA